MKIVGMVLVKPLKGGRVCRAGHGITQAPVQRKALAVLEARASPLAPRESVESGQDVRRIIQTCRAGTSSDDASWLHVGNA